MDSYSLLLVVHLATVIYSDPKTKSAILYPASAHAKMVLLDSFANDARKIISVMLMAPVVIVCLTISLYSTIRVKSSAGITNNSKIFYSL